jgi:hypothetical protein
MKLGIIGRPHSGRSTVFESLTRRAADTAARGEDQAAVVRVPDERVDALSRIFAPRKTIHAQVDFFLPGQGAQKKEPSPFQAVKECDALILVVRNHGPDRDPLGEFRSVDQDLLLADMVQVEKRLERLEAERRRGKKTSAEEHHLLTACRAHLEAETPLRHVPEIAGAKLLRGFALLSAKPMLVVCNNADDDRHLPDLGEAAARETLIVVRGKLEQELSRLSAEEAADFLADYRIESSATDRMIRLSYAALGLISFFTVGEDEVRAWTIPRGTPAVEAAGVIHTDLQKGFIRAEVIACADFLAAGSMAEARRRGSLRLEGKNYVVEDGDILTIRFNV